MEANLIIQVLATLALVLGILAGESVATKAFGMLKKSWMYIIEILLFVIAIVILMDNFTITEFDSTTIILFYFLIGFLVIIGIRSLMTGFGIMAEQVKHKGLKIKKEEDYIVGLRKALERRGFEKREIRRIAKEIGFKKRKIEDIFDYWGK